MSDVRKQSSITDEAMMDAFRQGLAEGFVESTQELMWVVKVSFEGTLLNLRSFDDINDALHYCGQHLTTAGESIEIAVAVKGAPKNPPQAQVALDSASDDDIVDAEVVDP